MPGPYPIQVQAGLWCRAFSIPKPVRTAHEHVSVILLRFSSHTVKQLWTLGLVSHPIAPKRGADTLRSSQETGFTPPPCTLLDVGGRQAELEKWKTEKDTPS